MCRAARPGVQLTPTGTALRLLAGGIVTQLRIKDFDIGSARFVNLGIASWLLVSVFAWRHSEPQFLVTMLVGVVVAIVAPFEVGSPVVR